ncbi:MAG: threonine-phosphate decarboxylase CobD [Arenibacterium sp.]
MEVHDTLASRDHGGNLDAAIARFGGEVADWIDLSTGINPRAYPVPSISADAWRVLPRKSGMADLCAAAKTAYGATGAIAAFAGAQGAIQAVPFLRLPGKARVVTPTYNEHAGALRMAGWQVSDVARPEALAGADLGVVVNPNNPTGQVYSPALLADLAKDVGVLVVDESFVDPTPETSLAPQLEQLANVVVLRSFGKFYGLAGLRLGFALGPKALVARLSEIAGPWPVSGPAMEIAQAALQDRVWQADTIRQLAADAVRLDALMDEAGLSLVGGTSLFRTYHADIAVEIQEKLAHSHIWTRIFPYSEHWIRIGLPGRENDWQRLARAFK